MPIKSCIVSTGGGIVERNDNWSMMSHAIIIWLHGDTPLLARRVVADGRASRPLLKDDPQASTLDGAWIHWVLLHRDRKGVGCRV